MKSVPGSTIETRTTTTATLVRLRYEEDHEDVYQLLYVEHFSSQKLCKSDTTPMSDTTIITLYSLKK